MSSVRGDDRFIIDKICGACGAKMMRAALYCPTCASGKNRKQTVDSARAVVATILGVGIFLVVVGVLIVNALRPTDPKAQRAADLQQEIKSVEEQINTVQWSANQALDEANNLQAVLLTDQARLDEANAALAAKTPAQQAPYKKIIEWDTHSQTPDYGWREAFARRKAMYEQEIPPLQHSTDDARAKWKELQTQVADLRHRADDLRSELNQLTQ